MELEKIREELILFVDWWKKLNKSLNKQKKLVEIIEKEGNVEGFSEALLSLTLQRDRCPPILQDVWVFIEKKYPIYFAKNNKTNHYPNIYGIYACFFIKAYDKKIGYAFLLINPNTDIETNAIFSFDVELKSNYKPSIGLGLKQNDNLFLLFNDPRDKRVIANEIKNNPEQVIFNLGKDFENNDEHITEMMGLFSGTSSSYRNPVGRDFYCVYCKDLDFKKLDNVKLDDYRLFFENLITDKVISYFNEKDKRIIEIKDWEVDII